MEFSKILGMQLSEIFDFAIIGRKVFNFFSSKNIGIVKFKSKSQKGNLLSTTLGITLSDSGGVFKNVGSPLAPELTSIFAL